MAHSLADWDLNFASPVIKLWVQYQRTELELIIDNPAYSQNTGYQ